MGVLTSAYARLGFDVLGDDGFRAMVLARIVEPTSKAEVVRVLEEIDAPAVSLRTLFRSLARSQEQDYRGQLATAAWTHSVRTSGTAALAGYDAFTDTQARRWEPKKLRYRIFTIPATLARTGRRVWLHLSGRSPWAGLTLTGLGRLADLAPG